MAERKEVIKMICKKCGTNFNEEQFGIYCPNCKSDGELTFKERCIKEAREKGIKIKHSRDKISKTERYYLLKEAKWRCAICGVHVNFNKGSDYYGGTAHIDHIHPVSKAESYPGYINELKNFQILCSRCNLMKKDKEQRYCPSCKNPLEIVIFNASKGWKDYKKKDIEKAYLCNRCDNKGGVYTPSLFSKEEIESNKETLKKP